MMFKAKRPNFFKVILDDTIREGKLSIPRKFVRRYGNHLSGKVFLKVPSGRKWQVELIRSDGDIWFGKGWQQFVDYYSLAHGSFVVFTFENLKGCCFNVTIFDTSASEIDYPIHNVVGDNEEPNNTDEEFHQIITPEIIEIDVSPTRKLEEKSTPPFSRPCKKIKLENYGTGLPEAERGNEDRVVKRTQTLTCEEKANALKRANSYYKSNNISFSIVMQPSHVGSHFKPAVPASFARKYMKKQLGNIILKSADEKTWLVEYVFSKTDRFQAVQLCGGWRKFVEDNHLEVGDVCVFELMNHNTTKFKVVICRQNQHADRISPPIFDRSASEIEYPFHNVHGDNEEPVILDESEGVLEPDRVFSPQMSSEDHKPSLPFPKPACKKRQQENFTTPISGGNNVKDSNNFITENPYFKVNLKPSNFEHRLIFVPKTFMEKCKNRCIEEVVLQVEKKVWPVKLLSYPSNGQFQLSAGISAFLKDNSLRVGDVCICELISSETNLLLIKVSIFRKP